MISFLMFSVLVSLLHLQPPPTAPFLPPCPFPTHPPFPFCPFFFPFPFVSVRPHSTIVSKPKEFAHLIKNKFGSADNISQLSKFYVGRYGPTFMVVVVVGKCATTCFHLTPTVSVCNVCVLSSITCFMMLN